MIVYYSSPRPLVAGFHECLSLVCNLQGVGRLPHITASTRPLAGNGEYLFQAEVNPQSLARYKYHDPFKREGGEFFAIPTSVATKYQWEQVDFFEHAHEEWNQFNIVLFSGKDHYDQHDTESWSNVWVSRRNIVKPTITENISDFAGHRKKGSLTILPEFDPQKDYLIVEDRWRKPAVRNTGSWKLRLFAGLLPQWAYFPWAWNRWVESAQVQRSAIAYIVMHVPTVRDTITFAQSQAQLPKNRTNTARAWRIVADTIGNALGFDLGHIDFGSDTAVKAMPLKIAARMERGSIEPWEPPIPRPEFAAPDESGRILLLSPEGEYPSNRELQQRRA